MQRPPDRRSPLVLFARGTSEWISRVNQKHKQLIELGLSDEQKQRLSLRQEAAFVYSTLKLESSDLTAQQASDLVSNPSAARTSAENDAKAVLLSLRKVSSLVRSKGGAAELTPELLLTLHTVSGEGFRSSAGDLSRVIRPAKPEHLPVLIGSACAWYTAESFVELNPIEQASIVLLRLIDLQPFERANERTALVAASLFTMRSELPPIIIKPELAPGYRNALDEATRMNTKPMVEAIAEATEKTLEELIEG